MAHFTELYGNDVVIRVLLVHDDHEVGGAEFLANTLGLGGTWVQCSYTGKIRKQYPGPGYKMDRAKDILIAPQPAPSWALDAAGDWIPPVEKPKDGKRYKWDEGTLSWKL